MTSGRDPFAWRREYLDWQREQPPEPLLPLEALTGPTAPSKSPPNDRHFPEAGAVAD